MLTEDRLKSICITFVVLLLLQPVIAYGQIQENDYRKQARAQAKIDVEIQSQQWWMTGAFISSLAFNAIGGLSVIATSQVITKNPPMYRLAGKHPEYVDAYTTEYRKEINKKRLISTSIGCAVGTVINSLIIALVTSISDIF